MVPNIGLSPRKWNAELASDMRLLRWMGNITQLDHICNQDMLQRSEVVAIVDNHREAHPRWIGHVLLAEGDEICRTGPDLLD
ncbi:hypothetical protein Y032_0103g3555 [Ancylostoma ceylanicum]|uniref:Uncharacterized protein n=1 Tax=Ancylostoma ceylanicum TaxID=53326 RepID=A0A016TH12_9BILA|nr:hypothetical protein Y032_0103g3555 [Ancylostoma ceylanicum]